jgi:hypothetical protein
MDHADQEWDNLADYVHELEKVARAAQELSDALDRLPARSLESVVQVHNRLTAAIKRVPR